MNTREMGFGQSSYDVFLSHNHRQKPWVRAFCQLLRACGIRVFFDEDSIAPGGDFVRTIEDAISRSRRVFLILSPASAASHWVEMEMALTILGDPATSNCSLVPILFEPVDAAILRPAVRRLNCVDLTDPQSRNDRLMYLLRSIGVFTSAEMVASLWASTTPLTGGEHLTVATISDITSWGWDGTRLLEELIKLDYETIDGLTADHEGNVGQWSPVFMDHPDTWRLIVDGPERIVGYWHFVPLFDREFKQAKQGKLLDGQITTDKIRMFEVGGQYDIYWVSLCIKSVYRRSFAVSPLLRSLLDLMRDLAQEGIFFRELCANAYTPTGVAMCKSFDLRYVGEHVTRGQMYARRVYPFPPLHVISERPELIDLYGREYWTTKKAQSAGA